MIYLVILVVSIIIGILISEIKYWKNKYKTDVETYQFWSKNLENKLIEKGVNEADLIDEFRVRYRMDKFSEYDYYIQLAIESNIMLPKKYHNKLIEFFNIHPSYKSKYKDYWNIITKY